MLVFASPRRRAASEAALVLRSRGIPYRWIEERGAFTLRVSDDAEAAALAELAAYESENRGWPPPKDERAPLFSDGWIGAAGWAATLVLLFQLERHGAFGLPWREAGRGQGDLVRAGEWWRVVTALTLHTDAPHLVSNLVFGALFTALVAQLLGAGLGVLAVLAGGAFGNLLNAHLQPAGVASIGASTAVFAAIGLLVGYQVRRQERLRRSRRQRAITVLFGLVFLGYLGMSGERTDVLAHVCGLAAGGSLGLTLGVVRGARLGSLAFQVACGALALGALLLAWALALA